MCTHTFRLKDTHRHTNTHNKNSVNEWEGAGRLAGAVLVEDTASVHLSISKHSQLSSLSTGGEVIFFFSPLSPLHHHLLFSSFLLSPFCSSLFSRLILSPPHLSFYILPPLSFYLFFPAFSCFSFSTPPFSSPSPPRRLLCSQWNSPFSNKTKLPTASHAG